jgi:hypothetical protein
MVGTIHAYGTTMKFTFSWLKSHLETEATLEEINEALTDLGLEVGRAAVRDAGPRERLNR